jgi:hypothetical protein
MGWMCKMIERSLSAISRENSGRNMSIVEQERSFLVCCGKGS